MATLIHGRHVGQWREAHHRPKSLAEARSGARTWNVGKALYTGLEAAVKFILWCVMAAVGVFTQFLICVAILFSAPLAPFAPLLPLLGMVLMVEWMSRAAQVILAAVSAP